MAATSAGLLLHRERGGDVEVFIAHMGGPFWAKKDASAWSIPKGEIDDGEGARTAALREFTEEIGTAPPDGEPVDLGVFRYSSGKTVQVFALEASDFEVDRVVSETFELEWPPRSGRRQAFPEVDRAEWTAVDVARERLVAGQRPALDALLELPTLRG
ncbi:NUDIX domain-containing protein [Agromyces soli]